MNQELGQVEVLEAVDVTIRIIMEFFWWNNLVQVNYGHHSGYQAFMHCSV